MQIILHVHIYSWINICIGITLKVYITLYVQQNVIKFNVININE